MSETQRPARRLPTGIREHEVPRAVAEDEHTLSVLVENKPGVLSRVAGLFTRRNFNIKSLAVGETENPDYSRMTIVVRGDDPTVEQVMKQLNTLVPVIKVSDLTDDDSVDRELAMVKVAASPDDRSEVMQIAETFRASIVDMGRDTIVVEATGDTEKVEALFDMLRQYGIKETVRTGRISLVRGGKSTED
ncbi:MAG: acetolactate synthase small subunit [Halobacteriales archaeon]